MRKILFQTLLFFFYSQIFAQNLSSNERVATAPDNTSANATSGLESVLKVNIFAPLLGYSQFSFEKSINHFRNIEFGLRKHHRFTALMLNLGHQWAMSRKLFFELYIGGGAEMDNVKDSDDLYGHPFVLAVAKDNPSVNFAFTAGFRFGFLLK